MKLNEEYFNTVFTLFGKKLSEQNKQLPAVSYVAITHNNPFCVLISTILSLRTKDAVTLEASKRLFEKAQTPQDMLKLGETEIAKTIYPVGFYKTKAVRIIQICTALMEKFNGTVPHTAEELMSLNGVGLKTANLTLNLGFGINAICVDCHVHQISNRMGWIKTSAPEESEKKLKLIMPEKYWIPLNELLVSYGQEICTSVSPKCSECPMNTTCPKIGVTHSR